jgi:hypothetical protein
VKERLAKLIGQLAEVQTTMRIVYCEGCSRRLTTEIIDGHLAASVEEPSYCQNCCPKPVEPILNEDLVNKTINEARKKAASGIQKAARNHKSGLRKAVKASSRRWNAVRRNTPWMGALVLAVISMW